MSFHDRVWLRAMLAAATAVVAIACNVNGRPDAGAPVPAPEEDRTVVCESNADCEDTEYCVKSVGECDGQGACGPRPEVCTLEVDPVCGCDGKTYPNACGAAVVGRNVRHRGECVDPDGPPEG